MIIKSLSRKHASFGQLFKYIQRGAAKDAPYIFQNIPFFDDGDHEEIIQYFRDNAKLLPKRKRGNYLYHEILSFKREDGVDVEMYRQRVVDICDQYFATRATHLLGFAKMHVEKHHIHMHMMLSANEMGSSQRYRLSKPQFREIQNQIEQYVLEQYPELQQKAGYTRSEHELVWSDKEYQVKERTQKPSQKDKHKALLKEIFSSSQSHEQVVQLFSEHGISLYQRGQHTVVVLSERKYRLKSLGIEQEYQDMVNRLQNQTREPEKDLTREVSELQNDQEQDKEPSREDSKPDHMETTQEAQKDAENTPPQPEELSLEERRRSELRDLRNRHQNRSQEQDMDDIDFTQ